MAMTGVCLSRIYMMHITRNDIHCVVTWPLCAYFHETVAVEPLQPLVELTEIIYEHGKLPKKCSMHGRFEYCFQFAHTRWSHLSSLSLEFRCIARVVAPTEHLSGTDDPFTLASMWYIGVVIWQGAQCLHTSITTKYDPSTIGAITRCILMLENVMPVPWKWYLAVVELLLTYM